MVPRGGAQLCTGVLVKDWGRDPLARGAYTHPTLHALGSREVEGGSLERMCAAHTADAGVPVEVATLRAGWPGMDTWLR